MEIVKFANSVDQNEAALAEPTHLNLQCLNSQYDVACMKLVIYFTGASFVTCFLCLMG